MSYSKASDKKYPELKESAVAIAQLSKHLIDMVSGLLQQLRPGILDELGLKPALLDLVDTWKSRHKNIHCEIKISGIDHNPEETVSVAIYRLVQESLTNVARHANASQVEVEIYALTAQGKSGLQIHVRDNGSGFDASHTNGLGLPGMRERVEGLGGTLKIDTSKGTEIKAWLPI